MGLLSSSIRIGLALVGLSPALAAQGWGPRVRAVGGVVLGWGMVDPVLLRPEDVHPGHQDHGIERLKQ